MRHLFPCEYFHAIIKAHGAAHVYNHYAALPSLLEQHAAMEESFTASFTSLFPRQVCLA